LLFYRRAAGAVLIKIKDRASRLQRSRLQRVAAAGG
jgi:hypothetical protein